MDLFLANLVDQEFLAVTCLLCHLDFPLQSTSDFFSQWNNSFCGARLLILAVAHQTLRRRAYKN